MGLPNDKGGGNGLMANIQMIKTKYPIQEKNPIVGYEVITRLGWETNEKIRAHTSISIKINNAKLL
jgi:hypothetical protein